MDRFIGNPGKGWKERRILASPVAFWKIGKTRPERITAAVWTERAVADKMA
jgi:hypothetical protein